MIIGNRKINGVSPRFFAIIAGTVLLIVLAVLLAPKKQVINYLYEPAFPTSELSGADFKKLTWLDPYVSDYGLRRPETSGEILDNFADYVGLPVRFKAYLPPQDAVKQSRSDLVFNKYNLSFTPGVFLPPSQPFASEEVASLAARDLNDQPILFGFKNSSTPPGGQAYEITGLVYWRNDLLNPPDSAIDPADAPAISPVILVSSYSKLSTDELRAPTTQRVQIALNMQEGPLQVNVNRVEWSSGREVRACVTIANTGNHIVGIWPGINDSTADSGDSGSIQGSPSDGSPLATTGDLQPEQQVSGYLVFGQEVSDPNQPLKLVIPSVSAGSDSDDPNKIIVNVSKAQIKTVDNSETSNCSPEEENDKSNTDTVPSSDAFKQ